MRPKCQSVKVSIVPTLFSACVLSYAFSTSDIVVFSFRISVVKRILFLGMFCVGIAFRVFKR